MSAKPVSASAAAGLSDWVDVADLLAARPAPLELGVVDSSRAYWGRVGALKPGQKLASAAASAAGENAIAVSWGSSSSYLGRALQAANRTVNNYWYKVPTNRHTALSQLSKASDAIPGQLQTMVVRLLDPALDGDILVSSHAELEEQLREFGQVLASAQQGITSLTTTYAIDKPTARQFAALRTKLMSKFNEGSDRVLGILRSILGARFCSQTLRRLALTVNDKFDAAIGFAYLGGDDLPRGFGPHPANKLGLYFTANPSTVMELLQGKGIKMKLVPLEGAEAGQMVPDQVARDLPRLGTLTFQGKLLYDSSNPKQYPLAEIHKSLMTILGGEKALNRVGALLTQAGLAELTIGARKIGGQVQPILAQGTSQHIAMSVKDGVFILVHTLNFNMLDMQDPEKSVGTIVATRQVALPMDVLSKSDETYAKALDAVTVIDSYAPKFTNKAWELPAPAALAVAGASAAAPAPAAPKAV
jgi:hypothetical protein